MEVFIVPPALFSHFKNKMHVTKEIILNLINDSFTKTWGMIHRISENREVNEINANARNL